LDPTTFWTVMGATWGVTGAVIGFIMLRIDGIKDQYSRRDDVLRDIERLDRVAEDQGKLIELVRRRTHHHATRITNLMARADLNYEEEHEGD